MVNGFGTRPAYSYSGRSPLILVLSTCATLVFLGAAVFFYLATKGSATEVKDSEPVLAAEVTDVIIPLQAMEAGTPLEANMFRKESRAASLLAPSAITSFDQIKGAYAASFIAPGQPLLSEYVTMKRPVNQIQANIPDGYRAVTVSVDTTTSVEGWARTGAKVDVVLASRINQKPSVTVIVQSARVLSAGRQTSGENSGEGVPSTVTLLVTAEEAARIQLAANSGTLSLSLRGDEDEANYPSATTINIDSILGGETNAQPAAAPSEGTMTIDGKQFEVVAGKLVPVDEAR